MSHQVVEIYGIQAVKQMLSQSAEQVLEVFCVAHQDQRLKAPQISAREELMAQTQALGIRVQPIRKNKLDQLTDKGVHQGVLARVRVNNLFDQRALLQTLEQTDTVNMRPAFLVLEGLTDPHNLGACLRTAEAAGIEGVVVSRRHSVSITPTVRKVACGAAETVKIYQVNQIASCLQAANEYGFKTIAMVADSAQKSLYQIDLVDPVVIVMGAEGQGLGAKSMAACTYQSQLPMHGSLASLNVSVATGVVLFEWRRQQGLG